MRNCLDMNYIIKMVFLFFLFFSCKSETSKTKMNFSKVQELYILKGYPEEKIHLKDSVLNSLKQDLLLLNSIKGPIKYAKQYKIILKYKNEDIDTIFTNGEIFRLKNDYYKSKQNLFKKHNIN
jgi:hypothetical protein